MKNFIFNMSQSSYMQFYIHGCEDKPVLSVFENFINKHGMNIPREMKNLLVYSKYS